MKALFQSKLARLLAAIVSILMVACTTAVVTAQTSVPAAGTEVLVIRQGVLYAYSPATNTERNITGSLMHPLPDGTTPWVYSAAWSQDGNYMVLQVRNAPSAAGVWDTEGAVWTVSREGALVTNVTACFPDSVKCYGGLLSPNNRTLVFVEVRLSDGHLSLWKLNMLGDLNAPVLVKDGGFTRNATFSFSNNTTLVMVDGNSQTTFNLTANTNTVAAYTAPATPATPPAIVTCEGYVVQQVGTNVLFFNGTVQVHSVSGTLASVMSVCPAGIPPVTPIAATATPVVVGPTATPTTNP